MRNATCRACKFFDLKQGECRRFPVSQLKRAADWCGEFAEDERSTPNYQRKTKTGI
jgi:hypothetical protein